MIDKPSTTDETRQPEPGSALPPLIRAARFERGIYTALWRWLRRQPDLGDDPRAVTVHPYCGAVSTTIWVWIGASALEMVAVHVLLPWPVARWILLVISLWGLVWMVGMLAGLHVHPHVIDAGSLRIRNGHTIALTVPLDVIEQATGGTKSPERSRTIQFVDSRLLVVVGGQVNVHLHLREPMRFPTPGGAYTTDRLSCWADDPKTMLARLHSRQGRDGVRPSPGARA